MNSLLPEVSIILPTYNRADTIMRAICSVVDQTYQDWELIVIDDGSTDDTSELVRQLDSRIRVIRQENSGVSAARNTGVKVSSGRFIAFLDSDDEWLPHFLDLSINFLKAFPDEQYITVEFFQGYTNQRMIKNAIVKIYFQEATMIGSHALDLPPGITDDYLRVYKYKQPIGPWGTKCLSNAGLSDAHLYQGQVFKHTRWGYLAWLPTTVLTRYALETVGSFDTARCSAEDYIFQAMLSRHFRTYFISAPSARKHEYGKQYDPLKEDHLATGLNAYAFRVNRLHYFDKLHWNPNRNDRELSLVRKQYNFKTAHIALRCGLRREAIKHFKEVSCFHYHFWQAYFLRAFAFCCASDKRTAAAYRFLRHVISRITSVLPKK